MKLWHDDVRSPPDDSWTWARTNKEAMLLLLQEDVTEASLDHDLGLEDVDPTTPNAYLLRGSSPAGTGYDLAVAMVRLRCVPPKITIHSYDPDGAAWMEGVLKEAGGEVVIKPYIPPGTVLL